MNRKKKGPELMGAFASVLDLVKGQPKSLDGSDGQKEKTHSRGRENFEIFNFLEKEITRLECLSKMFIRKVTSIKENNQEQVILRIERTRKESMRELIVEKSLPVNSVFNQKIKRVFNPSFQSRPKE